MKILKLSLLFIAFIFAMACKKKSDTLDTDVSIAVLTTDGKNALSSPALYNASNISVYHIVNGQPQLYQTPAFGGGATYAIKGGAGTEKLAVYMDFDINMVETTRLTLIKFGNSKMDTLKGEFKFDDGSIMLQKVWFNGVQKDRGFNIVR